MLNIKVTTNWCTDEQIREEFNKCTKNNDYIWEDLYLIPDNEKLYDYIVVVNHPRYDIDKSKAIILDGETLSTRNRWTHIYNDNDNDSDSEYFKYFKTEEYHTLDKWYIDRTYKELLISPTKTKTLSGIVASSYALEGHKERLNFCFNYLDTLPIYDHYSRDVLNMKSYKGALVDKADGLLDYKYTFNAENNRENNYITEKLLDGILCECLTFYDGAPNVSEHIDPRCYIQIDLKNQGEALDIIKTSIMNNEWEKRIEYIREEKKRLMNERNVLNIIHKIINNKI